MHILNMRSQLLKESIDVYIKQRWWCFSLYENNFAWCCVIYKSRTYLGVSVWDAGWWSSLLLVCVLSFLPLTLSLSPCPTLIWNRVLHWLFWVSALTPLAGCPGFQSISHPTYCNASALSIMSHPHDESFMSQCQYAAETGCAPVARVWEQGVEEEEDVMLELYALRKLLFYKDLEMEKTMDESRMSSDNQK